MAIRDDGPARRGPDRGVRDRPTSGQRRVPDPVTAERPRVDSSRYRMSEPGQIEHVKVPDVVRRPTPAPDRRPTPATGLRSPAIEVHQHSGRDQRRAADHVEPTRGTARALAERVPPAPRSQAPAPDVSRTLERPTQRRPSVADQPLYQPAATRTRSKTLPPSMPPGASSVAPSVAPGAFDSRPPLSTRPGPDSATSGTHRTGLQRTGTMAGSAPTTRARVPSSEIKSRERTLLPSTPPRRQSTRELLPPEPPRTAAEAHCPETRSGHAGSAEAQRRAESLARIGRDKTLVDSRDNRTLQPSMHPVSTESGGQPRDKRPTRELITQSLQAANRAAQRVIERAGVAQSEPAPGRVTETPAGGRVTETPAGGRVTQTPADDARGEAPERSGVFSDRKRRRRDDTMLGFVAPATPKRQGEP